MFVLNSNVTIGSFNFSGINEVVVNSSLHSPVTTATIRIPSKARIVKKGQANAEAIVTGNQFTDGDAVTISLGYNNEMQTEFRGFVKRRVLGMPLTIECEGYSWLLRRNKVNISKTSISLKDYLTAAIKGIDSKYPITVQCKTDMLLNNVQINGTGLEALELIPKYTDGCIVCFFVQPDVLWCGLLYTPYSNGNDVLNLGEVKYRLGYNVLKDNTLRLRETEDDPVKVNYSKRKSDGTQLTGTSDAFKNYARTHSKILNQIKEAPVLQQLANEKAYQLNYSGYEGAIQSFLEPYVAPGYVASITDATYPERNGNYIIESVQTGFGVTGARRQIEIGPKVGFAKEQ